MCEICTKLEKNICKKKGRKKKHEKISECISDQDEKGIGNYFFYEDFTKDDIKKRS